MNPDFAPIIPGDPVTAYRDPACYYDGHTFFLFMTVSVLKDGFLLNRIGLSESTDLIHWTRPRCLTEENRDLNFSSPGNILKTAQGYSICICSYPMPFPWKERPYASEDARLYCLNTPDLVHFSAPEPIYPKGETEIGAMGRMIDPYMFVDKENESLYHLFFKQNGVSHSVSADRLNWTYLGHTDGGENACVVVKDGLYHLFHSPEDGIGHKTSPDLVHWTDEGVHFLDREHWDWASGRLTAGFVMEAPSWCAHRYLLFFHGSRKDASPETHGAASIALAYTDDFRSYYYEG